jgi:hypothetical protein
MVGQQHKSSLYARALVLDYWIVDINDELVAVYRQPVPLPEAPFEWSYADVQRLERCAVAVPVAGVTSPIVVADLLL